MSPSKKRRTEIDENVAAALQFACDRTCCVCRVRAKPYQIHHIDEDPSNGEIENLAVLCFDCHHLTQLRGGFGRKLDAAQIRTYKRDWLERVENKRNEEQGISKQTRKGTDRGIRYLQIHDDNDDLGYEFRADYPLFRTGNEDIDAELDTTINAYIINKLQRFRDVAFSRRDDLPELRKIHPGVYRSYLQIGFSVPMFTSSVASIEFFHDWYMGGAAHPNHNVETLNFRFKPVLQLGIDDLFVETDAGLTALSQSCKASLMEQKRKRVPPDIEVEPWLQDLWIADTERGAEARPGNYKRFALIDSGLRVHFDPYQVGSYAEGAFTVDVSWHSMSGLFKPELAETMSWTS